MNNRTEDASGPLTTPERATEITTLEQIGLLEFAELTGVGAGRFGPYRVDESGVNVDHVPLAELPPRDQISVQRAKRAHTLSFPCSPEAFMAWYEATCGTNGISDFSLAPAFKKEMRSRTGAGTMPSRYSCPSQEIAKAFAVKTNANDNRNWWGLRLRDPGKYGLSHARAHKGKAKMPSRWYPDVVAGWLIDKERMTRDDAVKAVETNFPNVDADLI